MSSQHFDVQKWLLWMMQTPVPEDFYAQKDLPMIKLKNVLLDIRAYQAHHLKSHAIVINFKMRLVKITVKSVELEIHVWYKGLVF
jgi:hypothetical protein